MFVSLCGWVMPPRLLDAAPADCELIVTEYEHSRCLHMQLLTCQRKLRECKSPAVQLMVGAAPHRCR